MSELSIADEWLRYASNDLIVAKHCFEDLHPKQTEIASYHLSTQIQRITYLSFLCLKKMQTSFGTYCRVTLVPLKLSLTVPLMKLPALTEGQYTTGKAQSAGVTLIL